MNRGPPAERLRPLQRTSVLAFGGGGCGVPGREGAGGAGGAGWWGALTCRVGVGGGGGALTAASLTPPPPSSPPPLPPFSFSSCFSGTSTDGSVRWDPGPGSRGSGSSGRKRSPSSSSSGLSWEAGGRGGRVGPGASGAGASGAGGSGAGPLGRGPLGQGPTLGPAALGRGPLGPAALELQGLFWGGRSCRPTAASSELLAWNPEKVTNRPEGLGGVSDTFLISDP